MRGASERETREHRNTGWVQKYLYDRWQQVRRHPEYLTCTKGLQFNQFGVVVGTAVELRPEKV